MLRESQPILIPEVNPHERLRQFYWFQYRWSLRRFERQSVKTGGRLVRHARYCGLLLAKGHFTRRPFGATPRGIAPWPAPAGLLWEWSHGPPWGWRGAWQVKKCTLLFQNWLVMIY